MILSLKVSTGLFDCGYVFVVFSLILVVIRVPLLLHANNHNALTVVSVWAPVVVAVSAVSLFVYLLPPSNMLS